jgi:TRAP-type C4-dicarboxylate transport system permease small subunit
MSSLEANNVIRRTASRLRVAVFAAMLLMVLAYVAARLNLSYSHTHIEYRMHGIDTPVARLIGDVSLALLLVALFRLSQMLGRISSGDLFSAAVIRRFRGFALWLLLMALFGLLAPIGIALLGNHHGPPRSIPMVLDFRELLTVGITLLLFLLASLLERARRLDEEMREFV